MANLRDSRVAEVLLYAKKYREQNDEAQEIPSLTLSFLRSLFGVDLRGFDISDADFNHADFNGANLSGAKLTKTWLSQSVLDNADLTKADLTEADLELSSCRGTKFTDADLTGTKIEKANTKR